MVRLKVAVAVTAGALAGGLAVPSAASADTAQVVYAWGYNNWGQAGADPNVAGTDLLSPVPVHGAAANVTQLSGPNGPYKGRYVLSLRSDGTVWGWGRNYIGVLGDVSGSTFTPVQIQGLPPNIVQISAGGIHAAALAADGSVWTWGGNNAGQPGYLVRRGAVVAPGGGVAQLAEVTAAPCPHRSVRGESSAVAETGRDLDDARWQAVDLYRREAVRLVQVTQLVVRVDAPAPYRAVRAQRQDELAFAAGQLRHVGCRSADGYRTEYVAADRPGAGLALGVVPPGVDDLRGGRRRRGRHRQAAGQDTCRHRYHHRHLEPNHENPPRRVRAVPPMPYRQAEKFACRSCPAV